MALEHSEQGRAFPALRCTFKGCAVVPDITVLPWSKIPRNEEGELYGDRLVAPDWMIEILSPEESQPKVVKNLLHALKHGTQLGWLVDPGEACIFGYTPDLRTVLYEDPEQQLPAHPLSKRSL